MRRPLVRVGAVSRPIIALGYAMDGWFEKLVGFREEGYEQTQARLHLDGEQLVSKVNGARYRVGRLRLASLGELRQEGQPLLAKLVGRMRFNNLAADVGDLHGQDKNSGAVFQVASQFNLLEMVGPSVTPEAGVTIYAHDKTQGPACAMAAGAATIYRNYLVDVAGEPGQRVDRQIDAIQELGLALGNEDGALWEMKNGYLLPTECGLDRIDERLAACSEQDLDSLRCLLRVGVQEDVQVTARAAELPPSHVTQVFCSALPVRYTRLAQKRWQRFALLVLEAAYEATFWAALRNAERTKNPSLFLTSLGGGAFGNSNDWIHCAMERAAHLFANTCLDVHLVSYRDVPRDLIRFVDGLGLGDIA